MLMRKRLIVLVLTLAAFAATISAPPELSARTCPTDTYPIDCGNGGRIICCPINAICVC
jgi:hypothetical protein